MLNIHGYHENNTAENFSINNIDVNHQKFPYYHPQAETINFHHFIQEKYLNRLQLMNDFQTYLERDDLNICYQPLIDLTSGKTKSVEALIRWQHKLSGAISPELFIPLAEQTGHIHALTFWVLNHALQQLHAWQLDGIFLDVAVNLSMFNLHDDNFPLQVSRLLDKWSIPPERLVLEITEGVMMHDPDRTIRILEKLNDLGTRLALDDFGSGYSSLGYLAQLPISELKIDRSLIMDIDTNSKNALIVRSTIELAKKLDLKTVAEGVESSIVCNILKEYGCDAVQGYMFSKPVNEVEFRMWYTDTCRHKYN